MKPIYLLIGLLVLGVGLYWVKKPSSSNPITDPLELKALELVQNYPARQAPTIHQAILKRVEAMRDRGKALRLGDWRVDPAGADSYYVSILIREKGSQEWIERDYAWQVNIKDESLRVLTLPATDLMPLENLPPLPIDPDRPAPD